MMRLISIIAATTALMAGLNIAGLPSGAYICLGLSLMNALFALTTKD